MWLNKQGHLEKLIRFSSMREFSSHEGKVDPRHENGVIPVVCTKEVEKIRN